MSDKAIYACQKPNCSAIGRVNTNTGLHYHMLIPYLIWSNPAVSMSIKTKASIHKGKKCPSV